MLTRAKRITGLLAIVVMLLALSPSPSIAGIGWWAFIPEQQVSAYSWVPLLHLLSGPATLLSLYN